MHGRDGLHAALGLRERDLDRFLGGAARLEAQQGGHGLQVVLDAVVDLADCRVLRHEFLLVTVDLGDVARQDDGAQALTPVDEGQGTHAHGRGASGDLDAPGGTAHDDDRHGFFDESAVTDDLGDLLSENLSGHVRANAEAAQARHGVGGRMLDAALSIQQDSAVEDSRDAVGGDLRGGVVGVFAARHHLAQGVGRRNGPPLEPEGQTRTRQVGLAGDDGDDAPIVAHGHAGFHHRVGAGPSGSGRAHDLPGLQGAPQVDFAGGGQVEADDVVHVDGRRGRGTAMGGRDEASVVGGQPQNQVGGRQVGEHLPVREEEVQPIDVLLRQRRRRGFFS